MRAYVDLTTPQPVEPYKLAARRERLEGLVALNKLPRLAEEAGDQTGDCHVVLGFGVDAQGRREIRGHLQATLALPCRRCMVPLSQDVSSDFLLGMIADEAWRPSCLPVMSRCWWKMNSWTC